MSNQLTWERKKNESKRGPTARDRIFIFFQQLFRQDPVVLFNIFRNSYSPYSFYLL